MNKSKLENGEVIERFEKKFGFNLWKEVQGFARGENEPAEVKVGKGWINISNDVKQFIYYALNQQRSDIVGEIRKMKAEFELKENHMLEGDKVDMNNYRRNPSEKNLEKVKMNEGTTAHYVAGKTRGSIEVLNEFLTKLEEEK